MEGTKTDVTKAEETLQTEQKVKVLILKATIPQARAFSVTCNFQFSNFCEPCLVNSVVVIVALLQVYLGIAIS